MRNIYIRSQFHPMKILAIPMSYCTCHIHCILFMDKTYNFDIHCMLLAQGFPRKCSQWPSLISTTSRYTVHVFYRFKGQDFFFLLFQSDNFTMIIFRIIHLIVQKIWYLNFFPVFIIQRSNLTHLNL